MTLIFISLVFANYAFGQGLRKANTDNLKRKWLDVAYASKSPAQKLDIYIPDEGEGPFPVILSIHGGAFKSGDKGDGQVKPMLAGLKRGYAVVSVNYRLSGEAIFPAQINDIKAAVRWVRANAKQFKLNREKIAAWGGSAGGHLAAMVGTSGNVKELEDLSQGNPDQSSRVQAVVDWFGPTDFLKMDEQLKESKVANPQTHSIPDSPESELIGKNLADALVESGQRRLRPVLMTSLAAALGLLPLAYGIGAGSDMLKPLAIAVIGALTLSVLLSLIATPTVYFVMRKVASKKRPKQFSGPSLMG
jgi:acetyl esterase/lipase